MPPIIASRVDEPGAMNRFQAIGPQVFGCGRPCPVDATPARCAVAVSCTRPVATPPEISSTRRFATPS